METISLDQLRYPVGKFNFKADADEKEIHQWISEIEKLPSQLKSAVKGLNDAQLNTPYRDGGWTVRQVVHQRAECGVQACMGIKRAHTKNQPTIKPYDEKLWAEMEDANDLPAEISLSLLDALHTRWVYMLKKTAGNEFSKTVFHPESKREMSVKFLIALYAWHSIHHVAHITELRKRNNW